MSCPDDTGGLVGREFPVSEPGGRNVHLSVLCSPTLSNAIVAGFVYDMMPLKMIFETKVKVNEIG